MIEAKNLLIEQLKNEPGNAELMETLTFVYIDLAELNEIINLPHFARDHLQSAEKLLQYALLQDSENSYWKHDLQYTQVMLLRNSLHFDSDKSLSGNNVSFVNEIMQPNISNRTKLALINYFQEKNDYLTSNSLLALFETNLKIKVNDSTDNYILTNAEILTEYYKTRVLQKQYEGLDYMPDCSLLESITDQLVGLSSQPRFLIANHFAKSCLGKLNEAEFMQKQLNAMGVEL